MNIKRYLVILSSLALLSACKKNTPTERNVASEINITSLSTIGIYLNGSNLKIEGDITDFNSLSSARVEIRNKNTSAILFQASSNTGNVQYYPFLWNWTISGITSNTRAIVKVIAVDKLLNEEFKEIEISLDN